MFAKVLGRTRRLVRFIRGRDLFVSPTIQLQTKTITAASAPWTIAPSRISPGDIAYCFGVGTDLDFEYSLVSTFGLTVHAFDPTPRSEAWVRCQRLPNNLHFHSLGLAATDGVLRFEEPARSDHVSFSAVTQTGRPSVELPVRRLPSLLHQFGHQSINILKMDIEGSEYEVIRDMLDHGVRPDQILVEFHHRFPNHGPRDTRAAIKALLSIGYGIAHVSSSGEEFLFTRNAR